MWLIETSEKRIEKYRKLFSKSEMNFSCGRMYLKRGEEVGLHSTKNGEEIIVVLSGEGLAVIEDEKVTCKEGDVLYIGPHTEHNIKAGEHRDIQYVYIYTPGPSR